MHHIDEFDCLRFSSHMVPSVESVSSPLLFGWCRGSSPRIHPLSSFQCPPPESIGNICAEGSTRGQKRNNTARNTRTTSSQGKNNKTVQPILGRGVVNNNS